MIQRDVKKVISVGYANSYPMNWGLMKGAVSQEISLTLSHPTAVAAALSNGSADIGLMPVAAMPSLEPHSVIGEYCIGTKKKVRTVLLLSPSPLEEIKTIYLDYRSVTSVKLVKIVARYLWEKSFQWRDTSPQFNPLEIVEGEGAVLIGDLCFRLENEFAYRYDLAEEWNRFTGLPFVFACWVTTRKPDSRFTRLFNHSLHYGISNVSLAVSEMNNLTTPKQEEIVRYLNENIDYHLDSEKKRAMKLFLKYLNTIK